MAEPHTRHRRERPLVMSKPRGQLCYHLQQVLDVHPLPLVSVRRCHGLLQRRKRRMHSACFLFLPLVGDDSFDGECDPRLEWLPRFCVGWELPACFSPRVQFEFSTCLLIVLVASPFFVRQDLYYGLHHRVEEPDVRSSSFRFW